MNTTMRVEKWREGSRKKGFREDFSGSGGEGSSVRSKDCVEDGPTKESSQRRLLKVVPVSPQLGKFSGSSEASRTDAIKKVWEYIKLHNLQLFIISYLNRSMLLYIDILVFIYRKFGENCKMEFAEDGSVGKASYNFKHPIVAS